MRAFQARALDRYATLPNVAVQILPLHEPAANIVDSSISVKMGQMEIGKRKPSVFEAGGLVFSDHQFLGGGLQVKENLDLVTSAAVRRAETWKSSVEASKFFQVSALNGSQRGSRAVGARYRVTDSTPNNGSCGDLTLGPWSANCLISSSTENLVTTCALAQAAKRKRHTRTRRICILLRPF